MKKIIEDLNKLDSPALIEPNPAEGEIHLLGQRMLLLHGFSLGSLRKELVERLGLKKTREIFTRLGYQQGTEDARRLREVYGITDIGQLFAYGPKIRESEGFVLNRAVDRMQFDEQTGEFWGDYYWEHSWEADAHLEHFGVSGSPACWMMTGYACGYTTTVMGRPIQWKEIECTAMGHKHCRVIGMPLEEGDDQSDDLAFWQIEDFISAPKSRQDAATILSGQRDTQGNALPDLVGASRAFNKVATLLKKVAATNSTVLLVGESGVGKERFSKALHSISHRSKAPFISINCAAIPSELVEAELFGVEKGAFTGAVSSRPGKFERANGGTLFLDEISSLPLVAQGKLLRAIQEREIERVGGSEVIKVDIRLVAAANVDLKAEVKAGRFREDLYYRVNIFPIEIPPLRERKDDIPLLVNLFVNRYAEQIQKQIKGVTKKAVDAMLEYTWPGNVRELENICERAVILAEDGESLDIEHLFSCREFTEASLKAMSNSLSVEEGDQTEHAIDQLLANTESFEGLERQILNQAMVKADGNLSAAARLLNMPRGQFEYRLKKRKQGN
ncbi:sigma-54-dependent Fis family transcriptional regulator [Neptuniibacter sp. CAU 1671]|uniref:sigma-54-dependent Fis family transcriptional regulator n=1 Tax=Neptuniibacter sp. CAU 1671 TaxID=3032593 RepID=UPI0023DC3949|nr:sigma-54-dependent Fis family transcriptional regulator [Neptuniibacter sp. CAU 1671]MDF2180527.1 sigma-54-dependent Fis family transcriptional regulator [Neptuniibacter sp. CAU 1671]